MTTIAEDIELIARSNLEQNIDDGYAPIHPQAWLKKRRAELGKQQPSYIIRVAAGMRARAAGFKITHCREVRGSHGMSHVFDPAGVDSPPRGWSRSAAQADYDRRHAAADTPRHD